MTIFKFALLRGVRGKDYLINIILPLAFILIRPIWAGGGTQGFHLMGLWVMVCASSIAKGIMLDKLDRTIIRILASPTNTLRYLSQNFLACMVPLTLQVVILTSLGKFLYSWETVFTIYLAICYTVFAMASITLLFAWSCLFKDRETSNMMFGFLVMFAGTLGGLLLPFDLLPRTLQYIGSLFPTYWVSIGIREILATGATPKYWMSLGIIALFAVAYLLYGGKRRII